MSSSHLVHRFICIRLNQMTYFKILQCIVFPWESRIKVKFRTSRKRWQSQSQIHELSRGKSSFFLIADSQYSSIVTRRAALRWLPQPKKGTVFASVCKRGTSEMRLIVRKTRLEGAKRGKEKRGEGKNRDANLPSRRRGQLCANAIPFSQVTRKTGHPPRSPYKKSIPSLLLSHTNPSPRFSLRTLLRDVIRQSRS